MSTIHDDPLNVSGAGKPEDSKKDQSSIDNASPPENPGNPTKIDKDNIEKAGKKEGITLGKIGNSIARGFAGAAGGPLYAASFLIGGGISLAVVVPALVIAAPLALLGAGIGALMSLSGPKAFGKMKKEARDGALLGVSLPVILGAVGLGIAAIPNGLVYNTTGRLGAGLCAFAMTGKKEAKQLKGDKFAVSNNIRAKSTNEKLLDTLFFVSLPSLFKAFNENLGPYKDITS